MQTFEFESEVVRVEGAMNPHGISVPHDVSAVLWREGIKRLTVWVNGHELRRGLQGSREFGSHLVVGLQLLKEMGLGLGDRVSVRMEPDLKADEIELCDELLIVLEQDSDAWEVWSSLTIGKRRGLAYHVGSAKREETRIKRALDIAMKMRTGTLHGMD